MGAKTLWRLGWILGSAALAVGCAWGIFTLDSRRLNQQTSVFALSWARQVAAQAEGLSFVARNRQEKDPIGWAVDYLTQGAEPRAMLLGKAQGMTGKPVETYSLDRKKGQFYYMRLFSPESGQGVRITLNLGPSRFLGLRTQMANDLAVCSIAFFLWVFFLTVMQPLFNRRGETEETEELADTVDEIEMPVAQPIAEVVALPQPEPPAPAQPVVVTGISEEDFKQWGKEAHVFLTQLGSNVRDLIREAQGMASAAGLSREAVSGLREQIHTEIREVREGRRSIKEVQRSMAHAETTVLNFILEARKMGADGRSLCRIAEKLYHLIREIKGYNQRTDSSLSGLEMRLEPWSVDADLAFHSYDDVIQATQNMDKHIKSSAQALIDQAKHLQTTPKVAESQSQVA